jgi:8-oxo-dGTP pyrophosphatase MutT (NUDIX family)
MKWQTHGQRAVYRSEWVELWLDDVEIPGGRRFEHHVLRFPRQSTTSVVVQDDHALMIWRHRFITDTWGWEVPAGWTEPDEEPAEAIRREIEEETGWRPRMVTAMTSYDAIAGISDMRFTVFLAEGADRIGEPDAGEGETTRVEWMPIADLPELVASGQVADGPSLTALSYYLGVYRPLHQSGSAAGGA